MIKRVVTWNLKHTLYVRVFYEVRISTKQVRVRAYEIYKIDFLYVM